MAVARRAAYLIAVAGCPAPAPAVTAPVRVATFNASLSRDRAGALEAAVRSGDAQVAKVAKIVAAVNPDVLVLNEVDHGGAAALLARHVLRYRYVFAPPVNTGAPTGLDLDGDGDAAGPGDAKGFGAFPGQFGLAVLSRHPIAERDVRCFGDLRWRDVPQAALPAGWYSNAALEQLPLSSKNHCVVPIDIRGQRLHVLVSHPTPPVFDGPEDRNGRRNHDEVRAWVDLLDGAPYLGAGLPASAAFVIAGDLNADPNDGDTFGDAIGQLLDHPRVRDPAPRSRGAALASATQRGRNEQHAGEPALDTADFDDVTAGNLRVDYVLPSRGLTVHAAGVFWPAEGEPGARWIDASDHRLVWVDVGWPPQQR